MVSPSLAAPGGEGDNGSRLSQGLTACRQAFCKGTEAKISSCGRSRSENASCKAASACSGR